MSRLLSNISSAPGRAEPCCVTRLFSAGRHRWDDLGFLDVEQSPGVYRAEHLFEEPTALVVGAPWLGKTTTARQLHAWLAQQPGGLNCGERLCLTDLGRLGAEQSVPPPWWEEWRCLTPAPQACWIIDALDEGEERMGGVCKQILHALGNLDGDHRRRLHLLIFSRQRDWLADFRAAIGQIYQLGPLREVPEFHLAPLDQQAARDMLAAYPGAFERVTTLIRRFNLQPVAGYPAALDYLRRQHPDANLSVVGVWRGLLQHLFEEHDSGRRRGLQGEPDERFIAAARIAAVLTVTGGEQVADHTLPLGLPTLADIFPAGTDRSLRRAAREACEIGPFLSTAEGGYRFAQRNVQDWLAAFGLMGLHAAQLRSALCDGQGRPSPRHGDLLPLLLHISHDAQVRDWIDGLGGGLPLPSDVMGLTLADSLSYIDRLERLASEGRLHLWQQRDNLRRLATPGLGEALAGRLRDPQRSPAVKDLLLDVASAADPEHILPAALELVGDQGQCPLLRRRALLLFSRDCGDGHFRQLTQPVAQTPANTQEEQLLKATVIRLLLERKLWSVTQAAAHAPPGEPNVVDDRRVLLHLIEERMTADDARAILADRRQLRAGPRLVLDHHRNRDLVQTALDRLLREEMLSEADQTLLIEAALEWQGQGQWPDPGFDVLQHLGASPAVRRRFYEHGVEGKQRDPGYIRSWSFALRREDWPWLLAKMRQDWADRPEGWHDLYRLARDAHEAGEVEPQQWEEVRRLVEEHAPGLPKCFEESRAANVQARLEQERRMQERESQRPAPTTLRQEVLRVLNEEGVPLRQRMHTLSWLCFGQGYLRPAHVSGSWDELGEGIQARVLAALKQALEQGLPTPIPEGPTFPAQVLCEAWAFLRMIRVEETSAWLTAERVQRWLPTAVFALHEHIPYLVRRCAVIDSPATVDILLAAAERELRRGIHGAVTAGQIPAKWWDNPVVTARVSAWAQESAFHVQARIDLLEMLTLRAPQCARPLAQAWSELPQDGSPERAALRRAGINCRLALDLEGAWPLVERDFRERQGQALEDLTALQGDGRDGGIQVNLSAWPVALLRSLGELLLRAYPVASDPEVEGGIIEVTPAYEIRHTRDRLVWLLHSREDAEATQALEDLATLDEGLRMRLRSYQARQAAEGLLAPLAQTATEDAPVPLGEAIRLLESADYRLVRNSDDLLQAVCEVLHLVESDVAADLPMLYGPPPRKKGAPRKHLEEDALQAYLRRRLTDLLHARVLDSQVETIQVLREDQVRFRRRLDLRVTAPCHGRQSLATVIIEVKWSDNVEVQSSLTEQLGRKYLRDEGLSHGVYLVGWCGRWRHTGRGTLKERAGLERYLLDQRDRYCAPNELGQGLSIRPVVQGLEWRDPEDQD